jgi:hypothetical protein
MTRAEIVKAREIWELKDLYARYYPKRTAKARDKWAACVINGRENKR